MKITVESTPRIMSVDGVECRLWEGQTAAGVSVHALISRIGARDDQDLSQFEQELDDRPAPAETIALDAAKESLMRQCQEELLSGKAGRFKIPIQLDLHSAVCIIANLQLALRHPNNIGPGSLMARETIDGMIERMREAGLTAHAELARLGDNPEYDL